MANGATEAVENATRLSEIGFPEFTAKLITDTFDAITTAYINQMAQYGNLVQAVSQTLQDFINNTVEDVSSDDINAFLVALGSLNDAALNFLLGDSTAAASLSTTEAAALNAAVALPPAVGTAAPTSPPAANGSLNATKRQTIAQAIARRIANNKYDLLQTMVRQGVLRLYVDNGVIETRLTFTTYGEAVSSSANTNRDRLETASATRFGVAGGFGGLVGSTIAGFGGAVGFG
jgi:hypothetical protein